MTRPARGRDPRDKVDKRLDDPRDPHPPDVMMDQVMHAAMCQCKGPMEAEVSVEPGRIPADDMARRGVTQFEDAIGGNVTADPQGFLDDGVGIGPLDIDLGDDLGGDLLK